MIDTQFKERESTKMENHEMSIAEAVANGHDFTERNKKAMTEKWGYSEAEADELCTEFKVFFSTRVASRALVALFASRLARKQKGE